MQDNRLKPLNGSIKIKYIIKEHLDYGIKTSSFNTYEDFGEWICRQFSKINIVYITDNED